MVNGSNTYKQAGILLSAFAIAGCQSSQHREQFSGNDDYTPYFYGTGIDNLPSYGDLNNDGRADIVMGTPLGIVYIENMDSPEKPNYKRKELIAKLSEGESVPSILLNDIDDDGDLDIMAISNKGARVFTNNLYK
jgi:hypothetical protein